MRNDAQKWDAPPAETAQLSAVGAQISRLHYQRITLMSGTQVRSNSPLPLVGWPDIAPDGPFAITLRRDRILEINGTKRSPGWDSASERAISDMTDGYACFQLDGPGALELLRQGAELSLDQPSNSAARMVFGLPAILIRTSEQRYALLFTRAHATAGWTALNAVAPAPASGA